MKSSSISVLDEQLTTPQFVQEPYPIYRQLREADPVHWSDAWQCWLLTRYDDVAETMRDFRSFSNVGTTTRYLDQLPPESLDKVRPLYEHFTSGQSRLDPPDHTRVRAVTSKAFTPRVVEAMRPRIEQIVDELIDAVSSTGCIDLIGDFANPLPAMVVADMFGFPQEDRAAFKAWSDRIAAFHGTGRADAATVKRSQEALLEARAWLGALIDQRRKQPCDDLLSRLANPQEQGTRLSEAELFSTCVTFMIGGHETTTNLIGNGMFALLQRPDQVQDLRGGPQLIGSAVEEMLRYDAPSQRAHRIAAREIDLRGQTIRKGEFVQQVLAAANRDPDEFDRPDEFNIHRRDNSHVSFGIGPHFCPGAPLARLEAQIAIPALLRRLPNLRLAEDAAIAYGPNNFFRGLTALPLEFDVA